MIAKGVFLLCPQLRARFLFAQVWMLSICFSLKAAVKRGHVKLGT